MRKMIMALMGLVLGSAVLVGIQTPAHAGDEVVAGSDSYGLYTQRCRLNITNNTGLGNVDACMRVSYWRYNDHIAVKRVRIWLRGTTDKASRLDVIYSTVTGPAGGINWIKENVQITKDPPSEAITRNWEPNFNQPKDGNFYLHGKVRWNDGSADEFSFTQTGLK